MKLRTEITIVPGQDKITYHDPVMLIGSCFTDNIGNKLASLLFPTNINPFGVVYNPMSVKRSLELLLTAKVYKPEDLEYFNDLWYSWDHHSSFSGEDKETVLEGINQKISTSAQFLKNARFLFISFGTARIYRLIRNDQIVCNCHKVPSREFQRELLKVEDIVSEYEILIPKLISYNPGLKLIFTVSPVRHWKDGAHGNQVSKAILHIAIHQLLEKFQGKTEYFPSYEILMDDLRDYRFYADDLLHPNELGIQYIWEKFSEQFFDTETNVLMNEILEIVKAAGHKFSNKRSRSSEEFRKKQQEKLKQIRLKLPFLNWEEMEKVFY